VNIWLKRYEQCQFPYKGRRKFIGNFKTFSVDFCIGYAERPPYFYFRSSSPTDLECVCHMFRPSGWKFSPTLESIRPSVTYSYNFLVADALRDLVTLTFDLLILVNGHTRRVTYWTHLLSLKILWLSVLELWVQIFPIGYHWQRVYRLCTYAVSRDVLKRPHSYLRMLKNTSALNGDIEPLARSLNSRLRFSINGFKFWQFGSI